VILFFRFATVSEYLLPKGNPNNFLQYFTTALNRPVGYIKASVELWLTVCCAGPDEPSITSEPAFANNAVGDSLEWTYTTQPSCQACLSTGGRCKWPCGKMVSGTQGTYTENDDLHPFTTSC
jgi:hypothetical protein